LKIHYYLSMVKFDYHKLNGVIATAGMDKTAVASALNVHLNTISAWTNPPTPSARLVRMPTPDKLAAVLRVVGWPPEKIQASFNEFYQVRNGEAAS
jgi:hypothetical protein